MIVVHLELPPAQQVLVQEALSGLLPHHQPVYPLASCSGQLPDGLTPSLVVTTPLSMGQASWLKQRLPGVPWFVWTEQPSFASLREQLELGAHGLASAAAPLEAQVTGRSQLEPLPGNTALLHELEALLELPLTGLPAGSELATLLLNGLDADAVLLRYDGMVFGQRAERLHPFSDPLHFACHSLSLVAGDRGLLVLARRGRASAESSLGTLASLAARLLRPQLQREGLLARIVSAKREWEATADTIPDPILLLDAQQRVIRSNQAFARLVGMSVRDVLGRSFQDVTGTPVSALVTTSQSEVDHLAQPITLIKHPERQFIPVHFTLELERAVDGYYLRDVTEERQLLSMVMQTERYSAFGELSHMLFHDLGSPAAALKMEVESALAILEDLRGTLFPKRVRSRPVGKPPELLSELEQSLEGARDASERVHQLLLTLQQYRQLRRDPESDEGPWVDLNRILTTLPRLYRSLARRHNIELEVAIEELPLIPGNGAELMRVFENLLRNAIEAQPSGGLIRLRARVDAPNVRIEVEDEGLGIAPEVQGRIFERGFSTRLAEGGTGLGLFYSEQVIRRHGGSISVSSVKGKGSCFSVLLPTTELS